MKLNNKNDNYWLDHYSIGTEAQVSAFKKKAFAYEELIMNEIEKELFVRDVEESMRGVDDEFEIRRTGRSGTSKNLTVKKDVVQAENGNKKISPHQFCGSLLAAMSKKDAQERDEQAQDETGFERLKKKWIGTDDTWTTKNFMGGQYSLASYTTSGY